ncbi:MAG: hypothetical protein Ct9H90mP25_3380 [Gammaproteobacteria bacterium]|nr:MAG: hypothetical protein Ct9H90mP25_3380 [Gammaproteobacteria bacterium]
MMFVPGFLQNIYLGNSIATTHNLVGLRWRSTSSAILFLILNIIGLGMGPFTVGLLSDFFDPSFGIESLRTQCWQFYLQHVFGPAFIFICFAFFKRRFGKGARLKVKKSIHSNNSDAAFDVDIRTPFV